MRNEKQKFDTICLIGTGTLAKNCARLLSSKHDNIRFFDANNEESWYLKKHCSELKNVRYAWLEKKALFDGIEELQGNVLIISAVNPYIIPARIVDNERYKAINLHHSLLPLHPGRNAEAWTIYDEDEYAGITWHIIQNKVDAGEIITQSKTAIDGKMTSWKLFKLQNDMAFAAFESFIDDLLDDSLQYRAQEPVNAEDERFKLHYSYEKPNGGMLDLEWSAEKMSAFLRAMDYGPAKVLGVPAVKWKGEVFNISRYSIGSNDTAPDGVSETEGGVRVAGDGMEIILRLEDR